MESVVISLEDFVAGIWGSTCKQRTRKRKRTTKRKRKRKRKRKPFAIVLGHKLCFGRCEKGVVVDIVVIAGKGGAEPIEGRENKEREEAEDDGGGGGGGGGLGGGGRGSWRVKYWLVLKLVGESRSM